MSKLQRQKTVRVIILHTMHALSLKAEGKYAVKKVHPMLIFRSRRVRLKRLIVRILLQSVVKHFQQPA